MKTRFLLLIFCFCAYLLNAQITLEHSFTNDYSYTYHFNTHNSTMFYNFNYQTNLINIYNADYSLYKTITVTPPSGYTFSAASNFSTKLFNLDNLIEFIVTYNKQVGSSYDYKMILYNENMTSLMDFGNRYFATAFITMDNKTKLQVWNYPSVSSMVTDYYSLPGTIPNPSGIDDPVILNHSCTAFPNPASSYINLPYLLKPNEFTLLRIFNSIGKLIEQRNINGQSQWSRLNTDKYTPGIYIFEYNGISNTFIVE